MKNHAWSGLLSLTLIFSCAGAFAQEPSAVLDELRRLAPPEALVAAAAVPVPSAPKDAETAFCARPSSCGKWIVQEEEFSDTRGTGRRRVLMYDAARWVSRVETVVESLDYGLGRVEVKRLRKVHYNSPVKIVKARLRDENRSGYVVFSGVEVWLEPSEESMTSRQAGNYCKSLRIRPAPPALAGISLWMPFERTVRDAYERGISRAMSTSDLAMWTEMPDGPGRLVSFAGNPPVAERLNGMFHEAAALCHGRIGPAVGRKVADLGSFVFTAAGTRISPPPPELLERLGRVDDY